MTAFEFQQQVIGLQDVLREAAYKFTSNRDDANDLAQETTLRALTNQTKFVNPTNLKGWLFTIMRNIFINQYRKARKAKTIIDTTDEKYFLNVMDGYKYPQPDSVFSHKELVSKVEEMDPDLREPFEMHTKGYKYKEIAEKLQVPMGTVKSRIFQARKKLMDSVQR